MWFQKLWWCRLLNTPVLCYYSSPPPNVSTTFLLLKYRAIMFYWIQKELGEKNSPLGRGSQRTCIPSRTMYCFVKTACLCNCASLKVLFYSLPCLWRTHLWKQMYIQSLASWRSSKGNQDELELRQIHTADVNNSWRFSWIKYSLLYFLNNFAACLCIEVIVP